jgi:hypothetical protein
MNTNRFPYEAAKEPAAPVPTFRLGTACRTKGVRFHAATLHSVHKNPVALVGERTIPTERLRLVGEVSIY